MWSRAPHPVTLRQLQYVVAVAERRSFGLAAADCHVSQPSLSAQIAQVEGALGLRLFERTRRGVRTTAAGEELVARARALLLRADELVESARRLTDPLAGRLRVGVIPTVAPYLLPEIGPALRTRLPKLQITWSEDRTAPLLDRMARGELDAAIVALDDTVAAMPHRVLLRDRFVLAVATDHPLASADPIREEELAGVPVLLLEDGHCLRDQALAICRRQGADEAGYQATSLSTLVQMAASGAGATLLPELAVGLENRRSALCVRPFSGAGPARTLVLAWRAGVGLEATTGPVADAIAGALPRPSGE